MTATHPIRAAIYLRQSLDATGDQLAVQRQREDCRRIAEHRGWTVVAEYVDNSISASDARKKRPAYDRLVNAYAEGQFTALICYDLDRLTRQPRQLEDWIDAATERGLLLTTANGEADLSTDGGRMYARIKATVGRAEVERKSARQKRAAVQRAEQGRPPLGPRLTGYTKGGELLEHEAVVVRTVFDRFGTGDSLRSLAEWLTSERIPTRRGGVRWSPSTVSTMLRNPRYAGRAVYDGQETGSPGEWVPIVADEVFMLVQAKLSDPRRITNRVGTDRRHLGSGLYECGLCGRKVVAWSGGRYRCPSACVNRTGTGVDKHVVKVIRARLGRPDLLDLLIPVTGGRQKELNAEVARLRRRLVMVGNDYDAGIIDGQRYKIATEKLRAELDGAEAQVVRLVASGAAATLLAGDPVASFDGAPLMMRRNVIDALCRIELLPAPRGRKVFDPESVRITPHVDAD